MNSIIERQWFTLSPTLFSVVFSIVLIALVHAVCVDCDAKEWL